MKNIFYILIVLIASSCKGYENLTLIRESFTGSNLKTNGYYYIFTDRSVGSGYEGKISDAFFLYQNGIYYNFSHGSYNPNLKISENIRQLDSEVIYRVKREKDFINSQPNWGVFNVSGNDIKIERWVFSSGGGKYPTQKVLGKIINDSTIHFYEQEQNNPTQYGKNKKWEKIDETYHFRQFNPKPDSTNSFIK